MKKIALFLISALMLSTYACKKDSTGDDSGNNNNTGTPTCRVKTMYTADSTLTTYYYDAQGRITKYTENDGVDSSETTYSYNGNVVSMNDGSGAVQLAYLNSFGLADSMVYRFPPLLDVVNKVKYNSAGQPIEYIATGTVFGTEIEQIVNLEFVNGNISKMTSNDGTNETITNYTYFLDKVNKLKSFEQATQFMFDNTNMVKTMVSDDNTSITYSYLYDTDGKVTQKTETDETAATSVTLYTWFCN